MFLGTNLQKLQDHVHLENCMQELDPVTHVHCVIWHARCQQTARRCCTRHAWMQASPCSPSATAQRCASTTKSSCTLTARRPARDGAWRSCLPASSSLELS